MGCTHDVRVSTYTGAGWRGRYERALASLLRDLAPELTGVAAADRAHEVWMAAAE